MTPSPSSPPARAKSSVEQGLAGGNRRGRLRRPSPPARCRESTHASARTPRPRHAANGEAILLHVDATSAISHCTIGRLSSTLRGCRASSRGGHTRVGNVLCGVRGVQGCVEEINNVVHVDKESRGTRSKHSTQTFSSRTPGVRSRRGRSGVWRDEPSVGRQDEAAASVERKRRRRRRSNRRCAIPRLVPWTAQSAYGGGSTRVLLWPCPEPRARQSRRSAVHGVRGTQALVWRRQVANNTLRSWCRRHGV